jgi:RNA polymerase-binding transcription factor
VPLKPSRLTPAQRNELRARLAARGAQLRDEVHEGRHPPSMDEVALAPVSRDAGELDLIGVALRRLDAADFGYCVDCGVGIALSRLMAEPYALRCTRCQERTEESCTA